MLHAQYYLVFNGEPDDVKERDVGEKVIRNGARRQSIVRTPIRLPISVPNGS
jgi:hypothetical protein